MVELKRPPRGTMENKWRVSIPLTAEEYHYLHEIARTHETSISNLGHVAILKLLVSAAKGEFSMVPEFQPEVTIHRA